MDLICIVCPNGCKLSANIDEGGPLNITGNKCVRGEKFAKDELTEPTRSLTTTVKTIFPAMSYLPIRTKCEIPKAAIPQVLKILREFTLEKPVSLGDVIITNIGDTGCDIIATTDLVIL